MLAIAAAAYVWFFIRADVYASLFLAASALAGVLCGIREREATAAFIAGLAPGWIGFSLGSPAAFFTGVLTMDPNFNLAQDLPVLLLSVGAWFLIGIPIGFLTGVFAAISSSVHSWFLLRRDRSVRLAQPGADRDRPDDPFGWRKRLGGK